MELSGVGYSVFPFTQMLGNDVMNNIEIYNIHEY